MKNLHSAGVFVILFTLLMIACETGTEDEEPTPDEPAIQVDPTSALNSLKFENATKKAGDIPAPAVTADLKIDKDTIFLVEGFRNRVQVLYPKGLFSGVPSFYLQVEGTHEHLDIRMDEEESTDTVGVFYIDFDPDEIDPPATYKIKIAPHDDDGTPIEIIEKDVVVEKKGDNSCSPIYPSTNWRWLWTTVNDIFYAGPNYPVGTVAGVNGCCLEGYSVDCISNGIPESQWINMDYFAYSMVKYEEIAFSSDGAISGVMIETTQNIDPSESDFCNGEPSYIHRTNENVFWGEYTYNAANRTITLNNLESLEREVYLEELDYYVKTYDKFYISSMATYEIISCHFLLETTSVEGMKRQRLFERTRKTNDDGEETPWYD